MQKGKLYVVATPIGNLDDITIRAINTLKNVDIIMAEDTRHTKSLLSHLGIHSKLFSLHSYNEADQSPSVLRYLDSGKNVALVVDAGTPLISDPGTILVNELRKSGVQIVPIPGPCALICALSVSGNVNKKFTFEGFLSSKSKTRKNELEKLKYETRTMIFYEAPHRLLDTLYDMENIFGENRASILAKELTKIHENIVKGSIKEIISWLKKDHLRQKGEFVLLVSGNNNIDPNEENAKKMLTALLKKLSTKDAIEIVNNITGYNKNNLYNYAKQQKGNYSD